MTILEALKSKVSYPLSDSFFQSVLIERSLFGKDEFTTEIAKSKEFKLSYADSLIRLVGAINMSEGDYSVSLSEKDKLINIANTIYRESGEPVISESKPTITYRSDWE